MIWIFALALHADQCFKLKDVRNAVCWAQCRSDGADLGYYLEKSHECVCGFKKRYELATESRIHVKTLRETSD
jgi:hypothetical protein